MLPKPLGIRLPGIHPNLSSNQPLKTLGLGRTEGAEAFLVCTHSPEAIAIATKLWLGGPSIIESCVLFFQVFERDLKSANVAKLGLNMAEHRPNMAQDRAKMGPTRAQHRPSMGPTRAQHRPYKGLTQNI